MDQLFALHMVQRGVGGQAQHLVFTDETQVVRPGGDEGFARAVFEAGAHLDTDARPPFERTDLPDEHARAKPPSEGFEPRAEVRDLNRAAAAPEDRAQDGGIGQVGLRRLVQFLHLDPEGPVVGMVRPRPEQGMKHRIAVEAGQAEPVQAALGIDQPRDGAIADKPEVHQQSSSVSASQRVMSARVSNL